MFIPFSLPQFGFLKKVFLLNLLSLILVGCNISGTVSAPDGTLLEGVTVTIQGTTRTTTTDAEGRYSFGNVVPGTYVIEPSKDNYDFTPFEREVVMQVNKIEGIDFVAQYNNEKPVFDSVANHTINRGEVLEFTLSASDPDVDDTLLYDAFELPQGAQLNAQTGVFSWHTDINSVGEHRITFSVTDGDLSDEVTITITVNNVAETITYKNDYPDPITGVLYQGTEDTTLGVLGLNQIGTDGNQNYGGRDFIRMGRSVNFALYGPQRGLIRFNIDSLIGQYDEIKSLTLRFFPKLVYFFEEDTSNKLSVYSVSAANEGWVEGTETETVFSKPADIGMVTWYSKVEGQEGWAGTTGARTPGVDYDSSVLTEGNFTNETPTNVPYDLVITGDIAQNLIDQWATDYNSGIVIISDNDESTYDSTFMEVWSSEAEVIDYHPELIIDYFPVTKKP